MRYIYADEKPANGGWSDWVSPPASEDGTGKLRHACCDCGLVHDVETRASETGRVQLRFKRNRRATHTTRLNDRRSRGR